MSIYLDTSVVVPLFVEDSHASRVRAWAASRPRVVLSRWTRTEFTSALSFKVRLGVLTAVERLRAEADIDDWSAQAPVLEATAAHFTEARRLMREDASLRAPDALHLALAASHRLPVATLDEGLKAAAEAARIPVVWP